MSAHPLISDEFVTLVEEMRQAQDEEDGIEAGDAGHNQKFALTRAKQKRKVKEQRVDAWVSRYRADLDKWENWNGNKKHSEQEAFYSVEIENGK
jgi:hypothetical protein